jgi:hypothetical protein
VHRAKFVVLLDQLGDEFETGQAFEQRDAIGLGDAFGQFGRDNGRDDNDWSGSVADFFLADRMYSISKRPIWLPDRTW